jgi:uncharacterized protein YecE (DUF72 family)
MLARHRRSRVRGRSGQLNPGAFDTTGGPRHRASPSSVGEPATGMTGMLRTGTSGFAYAGWVPRFYPADLRARDRLAYYATRLRACELNNTYYARPPAERLRGWRAATPEPFRFIVKAQKGATFRALRLDAADAIAWLTADLGALEDRLGAVLFRVPDAFALDEGRLRAILAAWPRSIPLVIEARHPSWHVDLVFEALTEAGASLCATDLDDGPEPDLRRMGGPLYVRLRRVDDDPAAIDRWAARLSPFVADGQEVYAILRHDDDGRATERAAALERATARLVDPSRSVDGGDWSRP